MQPLLRSATAASRHSGGQAVAQALQRKHTLQLGVRRIAARLILLSRRQPVQQLQPLLSLCICSGAAGCGHGLQHRQRKESVPKAGQARCRREPAWHDSPPVAQRRYRNCLTQL